jgi:hypothetical protein
LRNKSPSSTHVHGRLTPPRSCLNWVETASWSEEVTPTLKLKRLAIAEKYAAEIEALYT